MNIYRRLLLSTTILSAFTAHAQDKPIGYWQSHLPYNTAVSVATDGNILYTACQQSFFTYNEATGETIPYSKVEGMSDVGMRYVAYDAGTSTAILAYQNSNIDLFQNNTFYNIPDLKNKAVAGVKNINHIYTENGMAYLSTDIGVLVIDLNKREVEESYIFTPNSRVVSIKGFSSAGNYFYAITTAGLYRVDKRIPDVQNFSEWSHIDSNNIFTGITTVNNQLFVATFDSVFTINADTLQLVYKTTNNINHIDPAKGGIWISEQNRTAYKGIVNKLDATTYQVVDSAHPKWVPEQTAELTDNSLWIADAAVGLSKRNGNGTEQHQPNGPSYPASFDIYAHNKEVWVAHGGFTDAYHPSNNSTGFSGLVNGVWHTYTYDPNTLYNPIKDFVSITKSPINGNIYAGSFQNGLYIMQPDGTEVAQLQNPPLEPDPNLYPDIQVMGLTYDNNNNLWVSMFGSPHNLLVKTPDSVWYKYTVRTASSGFPLSGGPIVVDDNNQKWIVASDGGGVSVFSDNGTLDNTADDQQRSLTTGVGYGNLPSNTVFSIAQDKNGDIWVGTNNGIGIFNCGGSIFQGCDAQIPIVQYDKYAGYLFAGENVRSIAVDGANRKWVGTDNGVWLLSPDASKIIYRFTSDNSPLPSNHTEKITIDAVTGDVYIGTDQGLVTYHSTATEGGTTNSNVLTYPNPVPPGYGGTIAIKGLVANADVRITDVSGQLVYRTTALGGQAVWNGVDYTGHRPQSGVYLIFVTNSDGTQTYAGKMVFMQ